MLFANIARRTARQHKYDEKMKFSCSAETRSSARICCWLFVALRVLIRFDRSSAPTPEQHGDCFYHGLYWLIIPAIITRSTLSELGLRERSLRYSISHDLLFNPSEFCPSREKGALRIMLSFHMLWCNF